MSDELEIADDDVAEPKNAPELGKVIGRPSRQAAAGAIEAHVANLKGKPMRASISEALASRPKLGGKERRYIAFAARELSRHLRWLELCAKAHGWPSSKLQLTEDQAIFRYALWRREITEATPARIMVEIGLPGPVRPRSIPDAVISAELQKGVEIELGKTEVDRAANQHSFPTWLAQAIFEVAPAGEFDQVLRALNREPALSFHVRPLGTRDALLEKLKADGFQVEAAEGLPNGIRHVGEGRAIFDSRWVKEGRLQVMDVGSQMLASLCKATEGMTAVDYCAGAGGKTLFLADAVGVTGRVYAADLSARRLNEAKTRAKELKLRQVSFPQEPRVDLADVVLVDAPCSGVGTLAREPDQKWKLNQKKVDELNATQLKILNDLAPQMKVGAVLVYGTCSLLRSENEAIVEAFLKQHPNFALEGEALRVWPHRIDGGGFFGARLKKNV